MKSFHYIPKPNCHPDITSKSHLNNPDLHFWHSVSPSVISKMLSFLFTCVRNVLSHIRSLRSLQQFLNHRFVDSPTACANSMCARCPSLKYRTLYVCHVITPFEVEWHLTTSKHGGALGSAKLPLKVCTDSL